MTPNDACSLLSRLLAEAERELARPAFRGPDNAAFEQFIADVRSAKRAPAESSAERYVGAIADLMAQALQLCNRARGVGDTRGVTAFTQLIGVMAPLIREDYGRALEARRKGAA